MDLQRLSTARCKLFCFPDARFHRGCPTAVFAHWLSEFWNAFALIPSKAARKIQRIVFRRSSFNGAMRKALTQTARAVHNRRLSAMTFFVYEQRPTDGHGYSDGSAYFSLGACVVLSHSWNVGVEGYAYYGFSNWKYLLYTASGRWLALFLVSFWLCTRKFRVAAVIGKDLQTCYFVEPVNYRK